MTRGRGGSGAEVSVNLIITFFNWHVVSYLRESTIKQKLRIITFFNWHAVSSYERQCLYCYTVETELKVTQSALDQLA